MVEEPRVRQIVDEAVDPLRDALFGPKHPVTDERVERRGMEFQLREVHRRVTNGGIPADLRVDRNTKIMLAVIGMVQAITVATIVAVFA